MNTKPTVYADYLSVLNTLINGVKAVRYYREVMHYVFFVQVWSAMLGGTSIYEEMRPADEAASTAYYAAITKDA